MFLKVLVRENRHFFYAQLLKTKNMLYNIQIYDVLCCLCYIFAINKNKGIFINTLKLTVMTAAVFTINLGGNKVVFMVNRPYEGDGFSVIYDDEVICDGYRSGNWFYFLSMSEKVKLFEDIFKAEVRKTLNLLFK